MIQIQTLLDKGFRNKHRQLALTATPNLPLIIWAVAALTSHLIKHGWAHTALGLISFLAIVIWALLEIFLGVNYFRRALGLLVLVFSLYAHFFR